MKRVGERALLVAHGTRNQPYDGVGDDGGGQFAAREHVVADGDFLGDEVVADALIHALVVSAEDNDVVEHGEGVCHGLRELLSVGRCEDDLVVVSLLLERGDDAVDGFDLHDHAGTSAEGIVVDASRFLDGVFSQVVDADVHDALVDGSLDDGVAEGTLEQFGNDADDVDAHGRGCGVRL